MWVKVGAVRHLRCRREEWSSLHGFALRASPAVKHRVSPPGTVDERAEILCLLPSPRIVYSLADTLHSLHDFRIHLHTEPPPEEAHHASPRVIPERSEGKPVEKWTVPTSDAGGVALKASKKYHPSLPQGKNSFLLSRCHGSTQQGDKQTLIGVTTR